MDRRPIIRQAGICWRCRARGGSITIKRAIRACLLAKHIPCPRYRSNATNKLRGSLISGTARIGSVMSRKSEPCLHLGSPSARRGQASEYSIGSYARVSYWTHSPGFSLAPQRKPARRSSPSWKTKAITTTWCDFYSPSWRFVARSRSAFEEASSSEGLLEVHTTHERPPACPLPGHVHIVSSNSLRDPYRLSPPAAPWTS